MNLAPIPEIKAELKQMYPMFRFDMKPAPNLDAYEVICYKGVERQNNIIIDATTPMNLFWDSIKAWMIPIIRNY